MGAVGGRLGPGSAGFTLALFRTKRQTLQRLLRIWGLWRDRRERRRSVVGVSLLPSEKGLPLAMPWRDTAISHSSRQER